MEVYRRTSEASHILADCPQSERFGFAFEFQVTNSSWQYYCAFGPIVKDRVGVQRLAPMANDDWHHLEVHLSSLLGVG